MYEELEFEANHFVGFGGLAHQFEGCSARLTTLPLADARSWPAPPHSLFSRTPLTLVRECLGKRASRGGQRRYVLGCLLQQ